MCNLVETVVEYDAFRYIAQCEHGTLFLNWYRAKVHASEEEFIALANFIVTAADENKGEARSEFGYLRCDKRGYYQVWLLGMGLYLTADDFLLLVALMRRAGDKLQMRTSQNSVDALQLPGSGIDLLRLDTLEYSVTRFSKN